MLHPRRNPRMTVFANPRNVTLVVRGKNLPRKILDGIQCRGRMAAELIDRTVNFLPLLTKWKIAVGLILFPLHLVNLPPCKSA